MSTSADSQTKFYVGTSGWHYDHWRERFYPKGLAKSRWLDYYARFFNTVEINATFYRLPTENAFRGWYDGSPDGFIFALKASRLITHYRRLVNAEEALDEFLRRARLLKEKLGPVLYQLPPDFGRDDERLDTFLARLPGDLRHVVEFRHPSWFVQPVFDLLARRNVGFCVMDMVGLESPVVVTARTVYVRFHGSTGVYSGRYGEETLRDWARTLRDLGAGRSEVYVYFNNDAEAYAVRDAGDLRESLLPEGGG